MRNRQCIIIMVLFVFLTAPSVRAQHHPGNFGMGLTVSGSTPGFMISYASSHLILEPTFSMRMMNNEAGNQRQFSPGIGVLYQFREKGDLRLFIGARAGLNILRTTIVFTYYGGTVFESKVSKRDKYVDVSVGPAFGGRYYFSDHLAVLGEFQVKAIFYDQGVSGENYRGASELSVSTSQLLAAYFYF